MNPLFDAPPIEVPLKKAPLARAICQIRFPPIMSVGKDEYVAEFQESLRRDYPLITPQMAQRMQFVLPGAEGPISLVPPTRSYRFSSLDGHWHLTLSQDFLAIETDGYTNREEFLARLTKACQALASHIQPSHVSRLGVRYIDRLRDEAVNRIHEFFRPEFLGPMLDPNFRSNATQVLSENLFKIKEGYLIAKWGLLPKDTTIDPTAIPPEPEPSWILDLDAYSEALVPFDSTTLVAEARKLVERIYTVFRWSVTESFDCYYGRE